MILRRALIALALLCAAALLLAAFGLNWFGASLLRYYGGSQVTAGSLSGPLWSPTAHDLTVTISGVQVSAQRAHLRLSQLQPFAKSARINVELENGSVNVRFKDLLGGKSGQNKSGGSGFHLLPGQISVRNMRLTLDDKGANIPNATLQVSGENGALTLQGKSDYGPLSGLLRYGEKAGQFWGSLDIDSDARIINTYWPRSIQGGRITGQYRFGGGKPVAGDLKVTGGVVVIPEAKVIRIRQVTGRATQRGSAITGLLRGELLGGPVQVNVGVDTSAKNWQVKGDAAPSFAALGAALKVPGSGAGRLKVTAGGWTTVNVKAQLTGKRGSFASIPFNNIGANYSFQSSSRRRKTTVNRNLLSLQADTTLLNESQKLWGNWSFGKAGTLHLTGQLAGKPLNLTDQIDAKNRMSIAGQVAGGPGRAQLDLKTKTLDAALSPNAYGITGQLAARGPLNALALQARGLKVGPLTLGGTGKLDAAGLRAKLGSKDGGEFTLSTGRNWRGEWQAGGLKLLGATLDGSGAINLVSGLSGRLQAQLPAGITPQNLQGPIALNWKRKVGHWQAGRQQLSWQGNTFGLTASDLQLGGLVLGGQVNYQTVGAGKGVTGQLTATGHGLKVFATGQGQQVRLHGQAAGVRIDAISDIQSPYRTQASLRGADIDGQLSYHAGLQFRLRTGRRYASGLLTGKRWTATGDVDLAALRPVLSSVLGKSARYTSDLRGNLRLNLLGLGGAAQLQASAQGAALSGLLTRRGGQWFSTLQAQWPQYGLNTQLRGQLYPQLSLTGPLRWNGQGKVPAQQLQARLSGPYRAVRLELAGQTSALNLGGVGLGAQALHLSGSLTPRLALTGRWGHLKASYAQDRSTLMVQGQQRLTAAGRTGTVNLAGTWRPDFSGALNAAGSLGDYGFAVSGPWKALKVQVGGAGLRAVGRVNAQNQVYQAQVSGQLAGLQLSGQLRGVRAKVTGQLRASDGQGGWADVQLRSLQSFALQAHALRLAGQTLRGNLITQGGQLSGTASLGPLSVRATRGRFVASGVYAQHRIQATGRLALPATLTELSLHVDGPYLRAQATGSGQDVRGSVLLKAQKLSRGGVEAQLPAQLLPLQAALTPLRANLGGLEYTSGQWRGRARLRYLLNGQAGTLALRGDGAALLALPSGVVGGQLQLLPRFGGALQADLHTFTPLLPDQLRGALDAGKLRATVSRTGATFVTQGSRWQAQPLQVSGQLGWEHGLDVSALLTQGRSRVPVTLRGRHLQIEQATLDAWALRPFVKLAQPKLAQPLNGQITGSLDAPDLNFAAAQAELRVNLMSGRQSARGRLHLQGGQLGGQLASDLGGQTLQLSGPLYPRAQAALVYGGLHGTIQGDARQGGQGRWLARVGGVYSNQSVNAVASVTPRQLDLSAQVSGAALRLSAAPQGRTWAVQGQLSAPDLKPLLGQPGSLFGTLGGTLNDLHAQLGGVVALSTVNVPARYHAGVLSVTQAQALTPLGSGADAGHARTVVDGQLWPRLNLSGSATLDAVAPGRYQLSASGPLSRPTLQASGTLQHNLQGFGVAGTRLRAVLSGKDFRVQAQGLSLSGEARGRTDVAGYVQRAALVLNTPYRSGNNALQLRGPIGWTAAGGWNGGLNVAGQWAGQALSAQAQGRGLLGLDARYGPAQLSGELGSGLWQKPTGTLRLTSLDVGRLWDRPGQLNLTGTARLTGSSWKTVQAGFTGRVQDVGAGDLSGNLTASYRAAGAAFSLQGARLQAAGQLRGDTLAGNLHSGGVELGRLLPPKWHVGALKVLGSLEASASLKGGLERLNARSLYLAGQQQQLGAFKLLGEASYLPAAGQQTRADLTGYALGGRLSARGALPEGVQVTAEHLNLALLSHVTGQATTPAPMPLSAQLRLTGDLKNPVLGGTMQLSHPDAQVSALVSGRVQDPHLHLRADLQGSYGGRLYADLAGLDLGKQAARLHLYGNAQQGQSRAALDMRGVWPNLSGQLTATLAGLAQPVAVTGQGDGHYRLNAGELGSGQLTLTGLNPQLTGSATLHPLALLGASGSGEVALSVSGPVSNLQLSAGGQLRNVTRSGVSLPDTTLNFSGTPAALLGSLEQGGQQVATLSGADLKLDGLRLSALGSQLSVSGSGNLNKQVLTAQLQASGTLTGAASLNYAAGSLAASGNLGGGGFAGSFAARANRLRGWSGALKLSGGPSLQGVGPLLSSPLNVQLSGPYTRPLATGGLGLGGAQASLVAGSSGLQLRLKDGPLTRASGLLSLQKASGRYLWSGQAQLARRKGRLDLKLSGEPGNPQAEVKAARGQWYAAGLLGSQAARLAFGDGKAQGLLRWDGQNLNLTSQAIDLARLDIPGLSGQVRPRATLDAQRTGQATLELSQVTSGSTLPYLGIALGGSGKLSAGLKQGAISAAGQLNLSAGALSFSAAQAQPGGLWQGQLKGDLHQSGGHLHADLAVRGAQASGVLRAEALPLQLGGVNAKVQGQVDFQGQQFNSSVELGAAAGQVTLAGGGGLANLLPALGKLTGLKPSEQGYQVQAQLSGLDLSKLGVSGVQGNVNGQLLLGEGSGTFVVRSSSLQLGSTPLSTRIDGTLAGGDWRLRGHIGDSALFGAVTGGNLSARMQLQALPVGSVITALTGKEVGEGLVTGVARIEAPLADPLSGVAAVVAERVKVTAGQDTLMGQGSLNFANRELTGINLQMQGAGTWDVHGQYTRQKVDLTAAFNNTTFTPILALIPSLENQLALKGSLNLRVLGRYEQPTASLTGRDLQGSGAGIQAQVPRLDAALDGRGNLSAQADITAAGTVGGSGQVTLGGHFSSSQLSGVQLGYQGRLSADALGNLGQAGLKLWQGQDKTWQLEAAATQTGTLRVSGQLAPSINLALSAQNYNLPIRTIYARESSLNGALKAVSEGDNATGNVVVSGDLNFARMLLGRVDAAATLPGSTQDKAAASTFVSPLPTALTTFAQPDTAQSGAAAKKVPPIFLKRVVFNDIPIRAPGNVRVDESLAQAELSADLTLSGTGDNPLLSGEVHNLRGSLTLRDNEFSIQKAVATFDGTSLYPVFSLSAQGQVPDSEGKRIGVQLQADGDFGMQQGNVGRALQLHTALTCTTCTSGNTYSEAELYSLLALGTPDITAVASGNNLTSLGTSAVSTALNVFVLGELQRNIAKALGVDVFRINSNLINADGTVDARFTVGTYLSKQFYVQYQVDLTGAGLIDATYTTDDGRLTFKASTPLSGLDLESMRPSFSASYNLGTRHSLSLGVQSGKSTKVSAGYVFRY